MGECIVIPTNTQPSISIIVPVFNEEKALSAALPMLLQLVEVEIIFVDGGSTDKSRHMIQEAGFLCLTSGAGRAKQMNTGANHAKGDIFLFLHIDTSISQSNLSSIRKSYTEGFNSGRLNVLLSKRVLSHCIISFFINIRSRVSKVSTGDQAMFVRQDIFRQLGGYADIALMEDVELSKRLKKVGKVACLKDKVVTSSRRWEQYGVLKTVYLMWKIRFLYWIGVSPTKLAKLYREAR